MVWKVLASEGILLLMIVSQYDLVATSQCFEPDCNKAKFSYDRSSCLGPASWAAITPCWSTCSGDRQSPINIRRSDAVSQPTLGAFSFNIGFQQPFQVSTINKGFKTSYKVSTSDSVILSNVKQFGLSGNAFKLDGFHFHAGRFSNATGSEHSFDGEFQPMEIHMVFYNTYYQDVKTASHYSDGLLVIGVMIQVFNGALPNPFPGCVHTFRSTLSSLMVDSLDEIGEYPESGESDQDYVHSTITLKDLFPTDQSSFYTYEGSLTTPPCSETVTWIVMKCPIIISGSALSEFKTLEISNNEETLGVHGNRRPVQRGQASTPFVLLKNF